MDIAYTFAQNQLQMGTVLKTKSGICFLSSQTFKKPWKATVDYQHRPLKATCIPPIH